MSKYDKLLKKLLSQPNDIDFNELRYVLLSIGCHERQGKGSHVIFSNPTTGTRLSVPVQKPLRSCYVNKVIKLFELKEKYDENLG